MTERNSDLQMALVRQVTGVCLCRPRAAALTSWLREVLPLQTNFLPLTFLCFGQKKLLRHKKEGIVEQSQVGRRYDSFLESVF